jgi:hypothetical protein
VVIDNEIIAYFLEKCYTITMTQAAQHSNLSERVNNVLENLKNLEKTLDEQPERKIDKQKKEKAEVVKEAEKHYYQVDDKHPEQSPYVVRSAKPAAIAQPTKSKTIEKVEEVLAERLDKVYYNMDAAKQAEFKTQGEETARQINDMIINFRTQAKKVLDLIKKWLSLIPGVNKFFIEQESKIKTQKIMTFAQKYKRENKK